MNGWNVLTSHEEDDVDTTCNNDEGVSEDRSNGYENHSFLAWCQGGWLHGASY